MNAKYIQPLLFPNMQETLCNKRSYQIKNIDDPSFKLNISVAEEDDPETLALERLGYFVVPEIAAS
jgi:hypothetical protein